jgi:hypothetical protein
MSFSSCEVNSHENENIFCFLAQGLSVVWMGERVGLFGLGVVVVTAL